MDTIVPDVKDKSPIRSKITKEVKSPKPSVKKLMKTNAAIANGLT
jgi:hypothetical protein